MRELTEKEFDEFLEKLNKIMPSLEPDNIMNIKEAYNEMDKDKIISFSSGLMNCGFGDIKIWAIMSAFDMYVLMKSKLLCGNCQYMGFSVKIEPCLSCEDESNFVKGSISLEITGLKNI